MHQQLEAAAKAAVRVVILEVRAEVEQEVAVAVGSAVAEQEAVMREERMAVVAVAASPCSTR